MVRLASGPKLTSTIALHMSALGGKADIVKCGFYLDNSPAS